MARRKTLMASAVESATSYSSDCAVLEASVVEWSMEDVDLLASWIDETDGNATENRHVLPADQPEKPPSSITVTSTDRNATRQRRRNEMAYLRERVAELESELVQLRPPEGGDSGVVTTGSEWEAIAQRQQKARERAELENHKLRVMLESQVKLAQTLERLLRKRDHSGSLDALPRKRLRGVAVGMEPESDEVVFERLLSKIDRSFTQTEQVLTTNGLLTAARGHRRVGVKEQETAADTPRGLYVEMTDVGSLPFPLQATASAAWRCITAGYMQLDHEIYQGLAGQDDVLALKYAVALHRRRLHVEFNARAAMKRFVLGDQIVDVWEAISETEGGHTTQRNVPGVRVRERGWTLFRQASEGEGGAQRTLVLSCMQMIPLISYSSSCPDADRQVGLLMNLALDYYGEQLDQAQHGMESLLLDEARNAATLADLMLGTSLAP